MTKSILLVIVAFAMTSCGLSEEARKLEETNLELANRLRRAESVVIPAMQDHIGNLEEVVDANQEVQNKIDAAVAIVSRASEDLDNVVSAVPATIVTPVETLLPEEIPAGEEGDVTSTVLVDAQLGDRERTQRHNDDAGTMRAIVGKLDEIGDSLAEVDEVLENASNENRGVTSAVSDEVVEIAQTTETIADEIAGATALADDAAARARSIRDKADVANIIGGAITTALGNIPIPGLDIVTGSFPQPEQVIPRRPSSIPQQTPEDGSFPWWLIPVLGGGGLPFLSKTVRGGVGKVFKKGQPAGQMQYRTSGPGSSSDARFLGEALMRFEAQEKAEQEATSGPDQEERLASILENRRQRRMKVDSQLRRVEDSMRQPEAPRSSPHPGQSGVFSMPADRVG